MFAKLSVRNIPNEIFRALEALADQHDRSTEGEVRQAIRAWVEPAIVQQSRATRRQELAERLNRMLKQVNMSRNTPLRISQIAERIGEDHAEHVENWFLGEEEPGFRQLVAVAEVLGVDPDWLKHGNETLYPVEYHRLSENPFAAVDWLLHWTPPERGTGGQTLKALHLVRSEDPSGNLYVVKESAAGHYVTYITPIHVSEVIGAGGESSLAALFVTLELLFKRFDSVTGVTVLGYQMSPDDVAQLTRGHTNPGGLLIDRIRSTWWEDIWDHDMAHKREYWPGWHSLYARIEYVIAHRPYLSDKRAQIKKGKYSLPNDAWQPDTSSPVQSSEVPAEP